MSQYGDRASLNAEKNTVRIPLAIDHRQRPPAVARGFLRALDRADRGALHLIGPGGESWRFQGDKPGPEAEWRIYDWAVVSAMAARGDIGMGETYIEGLWDSPDAEALIAYGLANVDAISRHAHGGWLAKLVLSLSDRLLRRNSRTGSRRNIAAHYDVGNEFYRLWLDETMTYSSALYNDPGADLAEAQRAKYDRLLTETEGETVLEIGCGWGGFAEQAADQGRRVTALTISKAQHAYAAERLGGRADIRLQDYRDAGGRYDSIVSIEMIEAVGARYWPTYFRALKDRLSEGGSAMIQAIVVRDDLFDAYSKRSDFIRRHTFPGGMLPSVAKLREHASKAGLVLEKPFHFGLDYMRTLQEWRARFLSAETRIDAMGYGTAFRRSWLFYLNLCAASFRSERVDVTQLRFRHA